MSTVTEENEFFFRICQLLMDLGVNAMRNLFDRIHPPHTLGNVLQMCKGKLRNLSKKIITATMWNVLYPGAGIYGNSKDFDITLLSVLFRNICHLKPPVVDTVSGRRSWDEDPPQSDTSVEADIVRLRLLRNRIYAHATSISLSSVEFDNTWSEITLVLVRMGGPAMKAKVDGLRKAPFTEAEKSFSKHLEDWYFQDQELKKEVETLKRKLDDTHNEITYIGETVSDKLCDIRNSVGDLTSGMNIAHRDFKTFKGAVKRKLSDTHDEVKSIRNGVSTLASKMSDTQDEVRRIGNTNSDKLDCVQGKLDQLTKLLQAQESK